MQEQFIRIDGMSCNHCVKHVSELLAALPGVEHVAVSLEKAGATIQSTEALDLEVVRTALDEAGFDLVD